MFSFSRTSNRYKLLPSFFPPDRYSLREQIGSMEFEHTHRQARARSHKHKEEKSVFIELCWRRLVHSLRSSLGSSDELSLPSLHILLFHHCLLPSPCFHDHCSLFSCFKDGIITLFSRCSNFHKNTPAPTSPPTPLRLGVKTLFTYSGWICNPNGRNQRIKIHRLSTAISVYKIFTA